MQPQLDFLSFTKNQQLIAQKDDPEVSLRHGGYLYGNINQERLLVGGFGLAAFEVGDALIVRMIVGAQVMGFKSRVLEISEEFQQLYWLEYPKAMEVKRLRKSDRVNVFFPAEIKSNFEDRPAQDTLLSRGMVINISKSGCCVSTKTPMEPESEITITFSLPGERYTNRLEGTVLRNNSRKMVTMQAVKFDRNPQYVQVLGDLERWLDQNLQYMGQLN